MCMSRKHSPVCRFVHAPLREIVFKFIGVREGLGAGINIPALPVDHSLEKQVTQAAGAKAVLILMHSQ